ncbi:MAG: hypothetical protein HZA50_08455 [Planctomycetes bacterium]|nr:hypothetical protein [Planctomycetota bacterium]
MIEIEKNVSAGKVRTFCGFWLPLMAAAVAAILFFRFGLAVAAWGALGVGAALGLTGLAVVAAGRAIYLGLMYLTWPIGWVVSHLMLAAVFFLIVTPIGLVLRLCRYDPMGRRLDRSAGSYWHARPPARDAASYFKQY